MKDNLYLKNNVHEVDDYQPRNHAERRKYIRNTLRNKKYVVTDHLNKQHITNELRRVMRVEKNFKSWLNRVQKAQKAGKEIHRKNLEMMYEQQLKDEEKRQEKRLNFLIKLYGEEKAQEMHEKELEVIAKKYQDYYDKK